MTSSTIGKSQISMPGLLLHIEGFALFVAAVLLYIHLGASGWLFLLLILAPDLSMIGYLRSPRVGAVVYDVAHLEAIPLLLLVIAFLAGGSAFLPFGLIWLAHIGMDRTVGYGLKYASGFKDTHLERV